MPIVIANPIAPLASTLLIHSNTTNGSTTFVDSSLNGLSVTALAGAQHTTADSKFGTSSMEFSNGTTDQLRVAETANELWLAANDFTVDFWVKPDSVPTGLQRCVHQGVSGTTNTTSAIEVDLNNAGYIDVACRTASSTFGNISSLGVGAVTSTNWHHIAYVRNSNSFYLFLDGILMGTTFSGASQVNAAGNMIIGSRVNNLGLVGKIDEFRIVNGTGVWTSNFTPPTAPYTS